MPYVVYALIDCRDTSVRYVGQTSDIVERFITHLRCGEVNVQKNDWILELRSLGLVPICRTLETVDTERQARVRERAWIEGFIAAGEELFNVESSGRQR
jgi:hypothetical protein